MHKMIALKPELGEFHYSTRLGGFSGFPFWFGFAWIDSSF